MFSDCTASVIFYDDTSEGEADEGPWVPSNPFIGHRFSKRLMAARGTIGDWERAQFQRGHIHSQGIGKLLGPSFVLPFVFYLLSSGILS